MTIDRTRLLLAASLALPAAMTASLARAESTPSHVEVAVTAGTLGIGPEVTVRPSPLWSVRASAGFLKVGHNVDDSDIIYAGKLALSSYGLSADIYPFKGNFRVSGGFRINDNKVRLTATPTGTVTVGDQQYSAASVGTLYGSAKANQFAPLATIGYGGALTKGLRFGIDAGALFEGPPRMSDLTSTTSLISASDIAAEEDKVNGKIHKLTAYPIVQVSLGWAF